MMPLVNDAMPSTSSTTRVENWIATIATAICTTPQNAVSHRDTRR